ncbi:MAG: hypothetical protein IJ777_02100 [Clostridia bacterium]|nr:hypothetical protein [Clostridia bacterium]
MENYFNVNPIEKLYLYQKEEFENQIVNINITLKKAETEEVAKFDIITDKLQELLKDKDYSEINKMIIDYELAKFKHEDMMYFWYYKLGFNDSSKLYK